MKNSIRKWTAYLLVLFLVLGAFPLLMSGTGAEAEDARAGEVVFNSIDIDANWTFNESMELVYATGQWMITVDFNLTQALEGVNVTVNVTEDGSAWSELYTEDMDDLLGGNHVVVTWAMNFTNETLYTVNATLTNWNGSVEEWLEVELTCELVYNVFVMAGLASDEAETGEYANETHTVMAAFFNMGNDAFLQNTTVNFTITNETNAIVVESGHEIGPLEYDAMLPGFAFFNWTPAEEGTYYLNVSYHNPDIEGDAVQYYEDNNVTIVIENVTSYDAWLEIADVLIDEGDLVEAWITVNNTGNVEHDFTYIVNVSKTGWSFEDPMSTGALDAFELDEKNQTFTYAMAEAGAYTLTVKFDLDDGDVSDTFDVIQTNTAPVLEDETELPATIYATDVLTFTVNYTDAENNTGDVYLYIDSIWNETGEYFEGGVEVEMEIINDTDDVYADAGEWYDAEWTATAGDHNYSLFAEDTEGAYVALDNVSTFAVGAEQFAPVLTDQTGVIDSHAGDELVFNVLYADENGDVGDVYVKFGAWNDTALNASNHTWEDGIWVAMENETDNWTGGAIFTYTIDTLLNMTYRYYFKAVDAVLGDVELAAVEFTIKAALPTEGVVSGMVTNENGENVTDAKVIIYYIEENSTFDNVTNKTVYNNITHNFDTTTLNGSYEKTLAFGTYTIYVTHADYEDAAELTFTLDVDTLAVTKDFELKAKAPTEYDVIVGPFKDGDGNAISGAVVKFTLNLTRALTNYTATTNATGYATFTLPVDAIPADTEMTITKGDYTETWKYGAALPILIPATPKTKDVTYGPWTDFVGWELTFMIGNDSYKGTVNDTGYVTIDIPKDDTVAAGTEFVLKKGDEEVKFKEGEEPKKPAGDGEEDSLLWLWIVIIVVVLLVIIIIVVMSKKKKPEPTIDLEEEEMEEGIGEDYDEDMDTLAEEEDFSDFEGEASDDEFDGVDDLESELEEFDEDEDLGFEDEELGDYEDEFGDEEFDDDIGDDFDDDFDDDLDEDFDDDF